MSSTPDSPLTVISVQTFLTAASIQTFKWLIIAPVLALSTIILCSTMTLISMLGMPDIASRVFGTAWARINLATMLTGITILRSDKLQRKQPYIIVANHQSLIDIYVLYGYLGMDIKWVMKQELKRIPFLGKACEKMGHIFIDRSNTRAALESIENARARIMRGNSVIFFPEGTRSRDGELQRFKKGAFRLALDLKLPVLPVTIHGTKDVLPSDTMDWHPGHIKLQIHDPVSTSELTEKDINRLRDTTRDIIAQSLSV